MLEDKTKLGEGSVENPKIGKNADRVTKGTNENLNLTLNINFESEEKKDSFLNYLANYNGMGSIINSLPREMQITLVSKNLKLMESIQNPDKKFIQDAIELANRLETEEKTRELDYAHSNNYC